MVSLDVDHHRLGDSALRLYLSVPVSAYYVVCSINTYVIRAYMTWLVHTRPLTNDTRTVHSVVSPDRDRVKSRPVVVRRTHFSCATRDTFILCFRPQVAAYNVKSPLLGTARETADPVYGLIHGHWSSHTCVLHCLTHGYRCYYYTNMYYSNVSRNSRNLKL